KWGRARSNMIPTKDVPLPRLHQRHKGATVEIKACERGHRAAACSSCLHHVFAGNCLRAVPKRRADTARHLAGCSVTNPDAVSVLATGAAGAVCILATGAAGRRPAATNGPSICIADAGTRLVAHATTTAPAAARLDDYPEARPGVACRLAFLSANG